MYTDERRTYARPELRHYGAITKLVQGNSGTNPDSGTMRKNLQGDD